MKSPGECSNIEEVRDAIDKIDHGIVSALGQRFEYVKAIMRFKATAADVRAPQRYQAVLQQRRIWAAEVGLEPDMVEHLYRDLIDYFIAREMMALEHAGSDQVMSDHGTRQSGADRE